MMDSAQFFTRKAFVYQQHNKSPCLHSLHILWMFSHIWSSFGDKMNGRIVNTIFVICLKQNKCII